MAIISKIVWKNSGAEVIDDIDVNSRYFWLNEKHIETKIGKSNFPAVTNKYDPMYKRCRFELVDELKYHPFRRFIRNDLAEKLGKTYKTDKINAFRMSLGFNVVHTFSSKQQSITETINDIFEGKNIQAEYKVPGLDYRIDIYFHKYKLAVEVDEYGHCDRDTEYEGEREEI